MNMGPQPPQPLLAIAFQHHQAGRLAEAETLYRKILGHQSHPDALNLLAFIELHSGRLAEARGHLEKAIAVNPKAAQYHLHLGLVLTQLGEKGLGLRELRRAVELEPKLAEAHYNLGRVLFHEGQLALAKESHTRAIELDPRHFNACNALGAVERALGRDDLALAAYDRALSIKPGLPITLSNIAVIYQDRGRLFEAAAKYEEAIALDPSVAEFFVNLGSVLSLLGRIEESLAACRHAIALKPNLHVARSNYLLTLHYQPVLDPQALFVEHRAFGGSIEQFSADQNVFERDRSPDRRLRVGYLSPDFRMHSISSFIEPVLTAHRRDQFELVGYRDELILDEVGQRLSTQFHICRRVSHLNDEQLTALIRQDRLDLLVDLAGHTNRNRMGVFARRAAPLQFTYLGYPDTTGLSTMDYRITDEWSDRIGAERFHSEQLVRLPSGFLCYQPPSNAPSVAQLPARKRGHITFGSFNNLAKLNDRVLASWAAILQAAPGTRITLKAHGLGDPQIDAALRARLVSVGMALESFDLVAPIPDRAQHLAFYGEIDIALDTFPYHGATTTCEALWMGVPVLTCKGDVHASLVGVGLLSRIGHPEWIAPDEGSYRRSAIALASDLGSLERIRSSLRSEVARSSLLDARAVTIDLENAYRQAWRNFCST